MFFSCCVGERPYVCDVCNKGFKQSSDLKKHKRTHTMDKPYKCPVCPLAFTRSHHCRGHLTAVHKFYRCAVCSALFTSDEAYEAHKKVHPGESFLHESERPFSTSSHPKEIKDAHEGPKCTSPITPDLPLSADKPIPGQAVEGKQESQDVSEQPAKDVKNSEKHTEDLKAKPEYSEFSDFVFALCRERKVDPEILRSFIELSSRLQSQYKHSNPQQLEQNEDIPVIKQETEEVQKEVYRKRKLGVAHPTEGRSFSEESSDESDGSVAKERKISSGSDSSVQSCYRVSVIQYHGSGSSKQESPTPSPASSYGPSARDSPVSSISTDSPPTTPSLSLPSPTSSTGTSISGYSEVAPMPYLSSLFPQNNLNTGVPNKTGKFSCDFSALAHALPSAVLSADKVHELDYRRPFPMFNPSWTYHVGMDYRMVDSGAFSAAPLHKVGLHRQPIYPGFPDRFSNKDERVEFGESLSPRSSSSSSGDSVTDQTNEVEQQDQLDKQDNKMRRRDSSFNGRFIGIAPRPVADFIKGKESQVC